MDAVFKDNTTRHEKEQRARIEATIWAHAGARPHGGLEGALQII
jgi:hypothetical protein